MIGGQFPTDFQFPELEAAVHLNRTLLMMTVKPLGSLTIEGALLWDTALGNGSSRLNLKRRVFG